MSAPSMAPGTPVRSPSDGLGAFAKRTLRKVARPFRRRRPRTASERWDRIYARNPRYTASGTLGVAEEGNTRDFAVRLEILRTAIDRRRRPSHSRALDAGCGNGLFTRELLGLTFDVAAFDHSARAVRDAAALVGDRPRFEVASLASFSSAEPFDFVICMGVAMCITRDADHASAFRNLASHVAPGGYLMIEEWLVPLANMGPEPPDDVLCRFRALEVYERLARESPLDLVDNVRFLVPHANQDKSLLIFARPGD